MQGMYVALDATGLRYIEEKGIYNPIRSNMSYSYIYIPQPADYNFMLSVSYIPYSTGSTQGRSTGMDCIETL